MSDNGKRRKWSAADKLRIVLAGMQPGVEVSELCRREGINPTQYYGWKKQMLSSATKIFDANEGNRSAAEENGVIERSFRTLREVLGKTETGSELGGQSCFLEIIVQSVY